MALPGHAAYTSSHEFLASAATYWSVEGGWRGSCIPESQTVGSASQSLAKPGCVSGPLPQPLIDSWQVPSVLHQDEEWVWVDAHSSHSFIDQSVFGPCSSDGENLTLSCP